MFVFYIMYLDTIHSPSLHVHPLPLQPPNKTKLKRKKVMKKEKIKNREGIKNLITVASV